MQTRYFITGTGTDIGKTFVTAALARQARALGQSVMAYKPVSTGFDLSELEKSDTGVLMRSLDLPPTPENIERVSPWRYAAPLAPSMAARLENRPLDFHALAAWSRKAMNGPEDVVLMEIVAGIMVPLDDRHTMLDWVEAIGVPALLVTGSYLGTISHTLTALTVLEQRNVPVHGLIVNESENSPVPLDATVDELSRWTDAPVFTVARRASSDEWQNVTELNSLVSCTQAALKQS